MDESKLSLYYNRCNDDALAPGDHRYVDIDAMEGRPRGGSWADRIARGLTLSRQPKRILVTGLRGTGKSTELLKLAKRMGDEGGPHHLVVLIDGAAVIDIANEIDIPDILMAIVHATERRVLKMAEGIDPDQALQDGFATRFWTWLSRTEVELSSMKLAPGQQAGLVLEMKTNPTLRQKIRVAAQQHFSRFLDEVRQELQLLEERAKKAGYTRITVVFDSLEKLKGLSTNWREVLASAERVFGGGAPYLELPIHIVYTVPPALLNRSTAGIEFMPMVKLFTRACVSLWFRGRRTVVCIWGGLASLESTMSKSPIFVFADSGMGTGDSAGQDTAPRGCACRSSPRGGLGGWLGALVLLVGAGFRRRR